MNGNPQQMAPRKVPEFRKYSYSWAESVVQEHRYEHSRATDFLCTLFAIGPMQVASWLATNQKVWKRWKLLVDIVEKVVDFGGNAEIHLTFVKENYPIVLSEYQQWCQKRGEIPLTWKLNSFIL